MPGSSTKSLYFPHATISESISHFDGLIRYKKMCGKNSGLDSQTLKAAFFVNFDFSVFINQFVNPFAEFFKRIFPRKFQTISAHCLILIIR